jgi:4-aminobutyrate aminotransferase-like enzyme
VDVRGRGLLLAVECATPELAARACGRALERGVILLPSGDDGRVLGITPPLSIAPALLEVGLEIVVEALC